MPSSTRFHSSTTGLGGKVFGNHTMVDVLRQSAGGGSYAGLGSCLVAALLNAAAGKTPYLTSGTIRKMWNDLLSFGYYEPTAGVRWNADQIESYLRSTMR
jgi:hypothetical protein